MPMLQGIVRSMHRSSDIEVRARAGGPCGILYRLAKLGEILDARH
jgi:hypothetical protein